MPAHVTKDRLYRGHLRDAISFAHSNRARCLFKRHGGHSVFGPTATRRGALRYPYEVRDAKSYFADIPDKLRAFDPSAFPKRSDRQQAVSGIFAGLCSGQT
jgi:hypothetical protein